MEFCDDDLRKFAAQGAAPLPHPNHEAYLDHDSVRIWHATYGAGPSVVLLHGGLGHSGNWGHQVQMLIGAGYRAVLLDSRGHGRSTRDGRPFSYEQMASDVMAVLDALRIKEAPIVGWSDGACIALTLARKCPSRVAGVLFFACNMDPGGAREIEPAPILRRCFERHATDYAALSDTPDEFAAFSAEIAELQRTQPNFSAKDLAGIAAPVTIVHAQYDEFVKSEHSEYLARSIPGAELALLPGVSHFAPLQRPELFNSAIRAFLAKVLRPEFGNA